MKTHAIKILSIVLIFFSSPTAQNQIKITPCLGTFIYNSENHLHITEDTNYLLNYGFELGYINQDIFNHTIQFDYSYIYSIAKGALEIVQTSGWDMGITDVDASLSFHTLDILLRNKLSDIFSYGVGPSFSFVNRSVLYDTRDFEDRLSSFNIGITGTIDTIAPLTEDSRGLYFYWGIKLRYLYGLLYDKEGRNLSNYRQHFLSLSLLAGINCRL